jgi:hypothetical protein
MNADCVADTTLFALTKLTFKNNQYYTQSRSKFFEKSNTIRFKNLTMPSSAESMDILA